MITEKIDGANFQIDIDCIHHNFSLGSRNYTIASIKDDIFQLYAGKLKMITNGGDIPYKLWNIVNKKLTYGT